MSRSFTFYLFIAAVAIIFLGLVLLFIPQIDNTDRDYYRQIEKNLEREIQISGEVLEDLIECVKETPLVDIDPVEIESAFPFYIYKGSELVIWSDNSFIPSHSDLKELDTLDYFKKSGWQSIIRKKTIDLAREPEEIRLAIMVPLSYDPGLSNKYMQSSWNEDIFFNSQFNITGNISSPAFKVIHFSSHPLFAIQLGDNYKPPLTGNKYLALFLILIGFFISFWISIPVIKNLARKNKILQAFLFLIILWFLVFGLFKITNNLNLWDGLPLFDSRVYASSLLLSNLFDLLLFSLLLLSTSIFLSYNVNKWKYVRRLFNAREIIKVFLMIVSILLMLYSLTLHFLVLRDIYDNSQISLDINHSLAINYERLICMVVFVMNAFSLFLFFHNFHKTWLITTKVDTRNMLVSLIIGSGIFFFIQNKFPFTFLILVMLTYLILLGISRVHRHFGKLNYLSLLYISGSFILSGVVGAYSITVMEQKRDLNEILRFGNEQLLDADIFGEFLMDETVQKIKEDPFIGNWMSSPFVSKDIIIRKITQIYIDPYLDRYDIGIYLYNQNGQPLSTNANTLNYQTIYSRVAVQENETDFENIYLARDFKSDMYKEYYAFVEVKRIGSPVGYVLIDFNQKRVAPNNVYPELLIDSRIFIPPPDLEISFAVYSGNDLLNSVGGFNYQNDFNVEELSYERIYKQGKVIKGDYHVAMDAGQRTLVVSARSHSFGELLSNFSFLFLSLILLVGIIFSMIILSRSEDSPVRGFASKIQLYLNLAFILPLLLVSFTTLSLLSTQSRNEIEEQYRKKGYDIAENIQRDLDNFQIEPTQGRDRLVEKLRTTASILDTDADLYNLNGGLIASTQPKIYELGLTSKYIDPEARQEIVSKSLKYYIKEAQIGKLNYNVTFVPVKTLNTGRLIGVLGLPFFDFKSILESQQIGVFTNILNIFSLLFLLLLIISYFVSQRLVVPLKMIAEKLTRTSLTGYNPPIEWHTQDEIGLLVGEYNRMIRNLEESKEVLTRTQKELAWREIARQVAHEIKNPLTPMKLTLQQLQRRITGTSSLKTSDFKKPVFTLLHQVDILRDIATSFSAFAKMPIPEMKRFELIELLSKTFNLHKNIKNVNVEFLPDVNDVFVVGDIKLMGRIVTNIILNAIQSSSGKPIKVKGKAMVVGKNALVSIRDNGPGIDEEIRDKVFLPSFSTKEGGSGIGLAIAKHGIEQSGGQIWFETETGKGTTFFIELPLAEE